MHTSTDSAPESLDQSSFTLNFNRMTGGFRGRIKVESPYEAGVYVTRGYTTSPIYESASGVEFARMSVQAASPNEAARDARIDPATAPNAHPGITFRAVNQGVYFPTPEDTIRAADGEGKRLPVGKAYVLMPFTDPAGGAKTPFVVELTAWPPKPKEQGADASKDEPVTWYGGSAKIFDCAAYLVASRKYGQGPSIAVADLEGAPLPEEEHNADGDAAHDGASKRVRRRKETEPPAPDEPH